jgi:hypothetical protein
MKDGFILFSIIINYFHDLSSVCLKITVWIVDARLHTGCNLSLNDSTVIALFIAVGNCALLQSCTVNCLPVHHSLCTDS